MKNFLLWVYKRRVEIFMLTVLMILIAVLSYPHEGRNVNHSSIKLVVSNEVPYFIVTDETGKTLILKGVPIEQKVKP